MLLIPFCSDIDLDFLVLGNFTIPKNGLDGRDDDGLLLTLVVELRRFLIFDLLLDGKDGMILYIQQLQSIAMNTSCAQTF